MGKLIRSRVLRSKSEICEASGVGWGKKIFPVMRDGAGKGWGKTKTLWGGGEDPILRTCPAPLPSIYIFSYEYFLNLVLQQN